MWIRAVASLAFAALVTTAAACSSVPEVTFSDDAGTASSSSGGTDAGPDVVVDPNCKKTGAEVCDDGIDNDCNGLADCADPACTAGYTCTDAPPSGWSLVAFSATTPPACPTGYPTSTDLKVVSGDGSGGSCACSCAGSGGAVAKCSDAKYTLKVDTGGGAMCSTLGANNLTSNTAACTAFGTPVDVPTGTTAAVTIPQGPTTCSPNVTKTANALTDGRECAPTKLGKGCPGTQVCVPKPTGMQVCAMKPGADACPAPFASQRRAGGSGTVDNRTCDDCSGKCAAPTACTGTLTLYSNSACNAGSKVAPINLGASCGALAQDFGANGKAAAYQATLSGGCGAPTGFNTALSGTIAWVDQQTICCKP